MSNSSQNSDVKKLISLSIIALLIIAGGIYLGVSDAFSPNVSDSTLKISKIFHDFGDIDIASGKVSAIYPITNTGETPVDILWGKTTCMCTEGFIADKKFGMHEGFTGKVTIGPGETKELTAVFDPMAHGPNGIGPITRTLTLGTNSTATETLEFKFEGNVIKKS